MKADYLFKQNIRALLSERNLRPHDLADWCHRTDSWLSKILSDKPPAVGEKDRGLPLKYLDRIADFFGLAVYQLFQPGIARASERRSGLDRRTGKDRRVSAVNRNVRESVSGVVGSLTPSDVADVIRLRTLNEGSRSLLRKQMLDLERSEKRNVPRAPRRKPAGTPPNGTTTPPERE